MLILQNRNLRPSKRINSISMPGFTSVARKSNIYEISFGSKGNKNPRHILLISAECAPYAKSGGMADVNFEFTKEFNRKYKREGYDIRVMIPLYNAGQGIATRGGKKYLRKKDGTEYEIINTGISADYTYGARKSRAELYKVAQPIDGVQVYFAYSKDFSDLKEEYGCAYEDMIKHYSAFSGASLALLKGLSEKGNENFHPGILQTTEWSTAMAAYNLKHQEDPFYQDIKSVHIVHDGEEGYQGKCDPFPAAINMFNQEKLDNFIKNDRFRSALTNIIVNIPFYDDYYQERVPELLLSHIKPYYSDGNVDYKSALPATNKRLLEDKEFARQALCFVGDYYYHANFHNKFAGDFYDLNDVIAEDRTIPWDNHGFFAGNYNKKYNPTIMVLKACDVYSTVSPGFLQDLQAKPDISGGAQPFFLQHKAKGYGILNGLDPAIFDPSRKEIMGKIMPETYTYDTYRQGKTKNKEALQELYNSDMDGKEHPGDIKQFGYLKKNPRGPLIAFISRHDRQKGIDTFIDIIPKILDKYPDAQILTGGKWFDSASNLIELARNKYSGRLAVCSGLLPVKREMAAADIFVMPSRFEPCGLMQMQAMQMGTIPVVSGTGGLLSTVTHLDEDEQNIDNATGFVTYGAATPDDLYSKLERACWMYNNSKDSWDKLVKNAMSYDSSWNNRLKEYHDNLYQNPLIIGSRLSQCA